MKRKIPILAVLIFIMPALLFAQSKVSKESDELEQRFLNPPTSSKPYVWWHWMGSNFSKYGITKDLEAMKAAGIGGATIFNLTSAVQESAAPTENLPWPEQTYRSAAYWEAVRFAASEAERLGLEIGLHNSVGYSTTGGPWVKQEQGMQKLVWDSKMVEGGKKVSITVNKPILPKEEYNYSEPQRKANYYKDIVILAVPKADSFGLKDVVNLTNLADNEGNINWSVPSGSWTIYRFGNKPTMKEPHPIPDELIGKTLEVDKMDATANEYHWHVVIDSIKEHLGEYVGKSFKHLLIDSYESGYQNWTATFRAEFIKRKGYDPLPWLVSFSKSVTGAKDNNGMKIINSEIETKRFDWDYTDMINRLYNDNGWQIGKKICNENNLKLQWEPYSGPFDIVEGAGLPDLPMGEFWNHGKGGISAAIPAAARAAGKTVVGAESFTGWPINSKFTEDPAFLKASAEGTYASGVNRLVLHHWVHQPFDDKYQPGMGMGWWGTHFSRYQTWLEPGKAFFSYLGRTQALLQYGEQSADYLCVDKQDGFSDLIATNDFIVKDIRVENHQIILPSGRKYAFVVFPTGVTMLPIVAEKIKKLVAYGAYVVSPKPVASPSLQDYPIADANVKAIGDEIWGNGVENNYQKGWVTTNIKNAIAKCNITPDCIIEKANSEKDIKYVHRQKDNTHLFYVTNTDNNPEKVILSFKVTGLQPELWQAEDASISLAPVWKEENGRTFVQLFLKGVQSVFVVFRKPSISTKHVTAVAYDDSVGDSKLIFAEGKSKLLVYNKVSGTATLSDGKRHSYEAKPAEPKIIEGGWHIDFNPKMNKPFSLDFSSLIDFSNHSNPEVKYFSGTAHYIKMINITANELVEGKRVMLDLGTVNDIVQVSVNQKDLGVLWYPPYKIDITNALKVGDNNLDIAVTNNWANRLIGDEQEPADFVLGKNQVMRGVDVGSPLKAYPDWFIKNQPRPSQGRKAFTNWYYYKKDSPLQPAGLAGPVRLQYGEAIDLNAE